MKTLSVSEAKRKLRGLVDMVSTRDEEVVLTKNGRPVAALISVDERDSWRETVEVLRDRTLLEEIHAGLATSRRRGRSSTPWRS